GVADRGVLVCDTGNGIAIAANKVEGIRAALVIDPRHAEMSRRHNDANVLVLGSAILPEAQDIPTLDAWFSAPFEGGRHARRLARLDAPRWLREQIPELRAFAADVRAAGFTRVLLLGMGGSSLAPEVFQRVGVAGPGAPTLEVLDSTDPAAIQSAEAAARLDH